MESEVLVEESSMRNFKLVKVSILLVAVCILLVVTVCYAFAQCVPAGI